MATAFKNALYRYYFPTYGLLISAVVKALARPEVASRVRKNLRCLIVDEHQDINPAQEKLIALLAQSPVELCVVADDDQSIYQWRASDVSNIFIDLSHVRDRVPATRSHLHARDYAFYSKTLLRPNDRHCTCDAAREWPIVCCSQELLIGRTRVGL